MPDLLLASTRKGLFVLARDGAHGYALSHVAFLGDNVTLALVDHRDGTWYAALNLGHFGAKLQRSTDHGRTGEELAVPTYGPDDSVASGDGKPRKPASLELIWSLAAGGANEPGVLWAGTIPGGLFRSDDRGATWTINAPLWAEPSRDRWFGGGYDSPGIHSICVDPRDPRVIRVALSTAGVFQTHDGGATWRQSAHGMFAAFMPPELRYEPVHQDVHRMVQCRDAPARFWVQHHNGVFRSDDAANTWRDVPDVPPSVFGFAVGVHPRDPDVAWFVPAVKDEKRVPVDGKLVVARTRDGGRTFETLSRGLPASSYDLVYRHGLAVHDDGDRLAIASTTGGLWSSDDQGDTWHALATRLPPVHAVTFA